MLKYNYLKILFNFLNSTISLHICQIPVIIKIIGFLLPLFGIIFESKEFSNSKKRLLCKFKNKSKK